MTKKPRRANLRGPGHCIFCGAPGLTHEHIWADWLKNYIPRDQPYHTVRKADISPYETEQASVKRQTGDFHSRRIYCVCKPCNTGWMSHLQELVRPYLAPMLLGQTIALHRRAQTTLSAWSAMMIMVAEYVQRDKIAIPQSDRAFLREHKKPPNHWRIWIGAHSNQTFPILTHNMLEFAEKGVQIPARARASGQNTHSTTVCVGEHLLIHAMSSIPARSLVRRWEPPVAIRSGLKQIWAIRDRAVVWPPHLGLKDKGIELLADDFLNRAMRFLRSRDA
jgi:hypothetical protein